MSFVPNTYIEDARFTARSFTDYVSGKQYMTDTVDEWAKSSEATYTLQKIREKRSAVKARHKNHRNAYFKYGKDLRKKKSAWKNKYGTHSNSRNGLSARERREMDSFDSHLDAFTASDTPQIRPVDDTGYDWEMFQAIRNNIADSFNLTKAQEESLSCTDVLYLAVELNMGGDWAKKPDVPHHVRRVHNPYSYGFGYMPYLTYEEPELGAVARTVLQNRESYDSLLNMEENFYDF